MDNNRTGELIRQCRKEKGLTQLHLAQLLHVTDRAVSKWERGVCAPDIALLEPLSQILEVSIIELIEGTLQDTPPKTDDTAITVIDYSSREIKVNTSKNRLRICICFCIMALALCVVVSAAIFTRVRAQDADEALFMNHMYAKLNQIIWNADAILEPDPAQSLTPRVFLDLYYSLHSAAEELEDGYNYVSDVVPSVASWWFSEHAAVISTDFPSFLTEQGTLSVVGTAYVTQLRSDLLELRNSLVGNDGMNLNDELSIDAFSSIILDFYYNH